MKLNGYRASHRNKWLLLTNKILSDKEFILFEYYLDCMDWDSSHEKFGVFEVFPEEIAPKFNKTIDTIRDWHNGLIEKGFVRIFDDRRKLYEVKTPERYSFDGRNGGKASKYGKDEKNTPTLEFFLENVCFSPDKVEIIPPKLNSPILNDKKALISYKNESKVISNSQSIDISSNIHKKIVVIRQKPRSEEEYQKIFNKNPDFSIEDMKLADECATEERIIKNKEQEKEIVEVFFNGDWNEYQKNIIYR